MSVRVVPAVLATACAVSVALLLFVPYVARQHRKRGEFVPRGCAWRFAGLLYLAGLAAYVLVPLPPDSYCAESPAPVPQLRPFASFDAVGTSHLPVEALCQVGLNVVLFLPLGAFARSSGRCGAVGAALVGFGTSSVVEMTQLTGIWFLHPCPYRLFDVDDLIANTVGAAAGAFLPVPRRRSEAPGPPAAPRTVTAGRRLLGTACDVLLLWWIGGTADRAFRIALGDERLPATWVGPLLSWSLPAVLLLLASVLGGGSTLGQRAVLLRAAGSGRAAFRRWIAGVGGLGFVEGAAGALGLSKFWVPVALSWCAVHAHRVLRGNDLRGVDGRVAVVDVRHTAASREFVA